MKYKIYLILIVILCFLIYILNNKPITSYSITYLNQTYQENPDMIPDYIISETYKIQLELMPILEQNTNEHTYELHVYDCTQFSENLVKKLKNLGFKAYCMAGRVENFEYKNHTWVIVEINGEEFPIEATSGYFIDTEEYKNYEVYYKNYCW
jgi:hypothetical protein